jgi:hypothetical protein
MGKKKVVKKPLPAKAVAKAKPAQPAAKQKPASQEVKPVPVQAQPHTDLGRNDPCYCGSGKKYKKCHLPIDDEAKRKQFEADAVKQHEAALAAKKEEKPEHEKHLENASPTPTPSHKTGNNPARTMFKRKIGAG